MSAPVNDWFREAYKFARMCAFENVTLPFGFFTSPCTAGEIQFQFPGNIDPVALKKMVQMSAHFAKYLPSTASFVAEKERVRDDVAQTLKTYYPLAHTALLFGSMRGDMDIALCGAYSSTEAYTIMRKNRQITKKFPIVDWAGISTFASENGTQVATTLYGVTETLHNGELQLEDIIALAKTQREATLFYGDTTHLSSFQNYVPPK